MRKPTAEETIQVMSLLRQLRVLLAGGRVPELIARHHAQSSRTAENQRLLQAYADDYLVFIDALIAEPMVMGVDENLLVTRPGTQGFGFDDCITLRVQSGKPMITELPVPLREVRAKKGKWRRSDEFIDGVDARIKRHLTRLGVPDRTNPDSFLLTSRFAWAGIILEYRDEMTEMDLPLAFHERAHLALDDHGVPPAGVGQEFWIVGDMGEGEFPLLIDAHDDIASNPLVYRGDSEEPTAVPEIIGSLSTVLTRCQRG